MLILCHAETPAGTFTALYENGMIKRVLFPDEPFSAVSVMTDDTLAFSRQAAEYFEGRRKSFSLPFVMSGTRFMQDVYRATLAIPYGMTATYSDIAFAAGYPRAMRAVGNALHANPLPPGGAQIKNAQCLQRRTLCQALSFISRRQVLLTKSFYLCPIGLYILKNI